MKLYGMLVSVVPTVLLGGLAFAFNATGLAFLCGMAAGMFAVVGGIISCRAA